MKVELVNACLYNTSFSKYIIKKNVSGVFDIVSSVAINNRYLTMKDNAQLGWVNARDCRVIK